MNETVVLNERDTKTRILDAAERLMAGAAGLDVSLRSITAEAQVNLAAVNYHFRSKDALVDAVIARRIGPMNKERLRRLDQLEAQYRGQALPLEGVLQAFFAPLFDSEETIAHIRPLIGKVYSVPRDFLTRVFGKHMQPVAMRFVEAFHRAAPELSEEELLWRLYFAVGMLVHIMNWSPVIGTISGGVCSASDSEALVARMVAFAAAGFRAPLPAGDRRA